MIRTIHSTITTSIALLLISINTQAEVLPVSNLFLQMDINKDGKINLEEVNKRSLLAKEFEKFDKNQDGNLDSFEFEFFVATFNI